MLDVVLHNIRSRSSVRRFQPKSIPRDLQLQIIEAARWAPSAGNLQPWHFYVVTTADRRRCLAQAALNQDFVAAAPVCIVVCAEPERSAKHYRERGRRLYCLQDTAAATQNILLAAAAAGLGSCWVGAFDEKRVADCLGLPPGMVPVALVPLGYPEQEPVSRTKRREIKEIATFL
ncbi:nitroreductase family protein [Candidatus Desulforudis audaxviator]|uniref:Nitroreductase n=1 Tax=Desulforudis audaxviator (strain MP104C) TaxID=477974 RepID=B1I457_DESAP|nr:nitroreductase family protein [Candidatus Desulforudis audaxviator]ACA59678.1 nitroreductase [Candidatus Desulforudis audaxviator MP104C]AZK59671.1 nitroreductase [Candidatus Desulforudis audaxviator]